MNGVALLLSLSALAVDYSFRTTPDKQQEYTIQIEPEVLAPLAGGEQIHSDVPPEAGQIQRLCIRIGMTPAPRTPLAEQRFRQLLATAGRLASADRTLAAADTQATILWPARANPEQSYGVTCGWQPDAANQQAYYVQIDPTLLRTLAAGDEIHTTIDPAAGKVARFIVLAGTQPLPQVSARPGASPTSLPTTGGVGTGGQFSPLASSEPPASVPVFGGAAGAGGDSARLPSRLGAGVSEPPRSTFGGNPAPQEQPLVPVPGAGGFNSSYPTASYSQPAAPSHSQPPAPAYSQPLPPSYSQPPAAAYSQPFPAASEPPRGAGYPPAAVPPPSMQPPLNSYAAPPDRLAAVTTPPSLNPAPLATTTVPPPAAAPAEADKPWTPFLLSMVALFFSIGGNLYLAWTALEFHSRYRSAIERLRSAARSS